MGNQTAAGKTKDAKSNFGKKGWLLIILAFLLYTVYYTFDNGLTYIVPSFVSIFETSRTQLYLFNTIGGWVGIVAVPLCGTLIQKTGVKKVIVAAMCVFIAATVGWAFAPNIPVYGICVIIYKCAGNIMTMLCIARLGQTWFPTKKGLFMGYVTVGVVAGGFLANSVFSNILYGVGLKPAMLILSGITLVILILIAIFVKNTPEEAGAYPDNNKDLDLEALHRNANALKEIQATSKWTYGAVLKHPVTWVISFAIGLMLAIVQGVMSQMATAIMGFGHPITMAMTIGSVGAIVGFFASIGGGILDQKIGTRKACMICAVIAVIGCLLIAFTGTAVAGLMIGFCFMFAAASFGNNMIASMPQSIWGRYDIAKAHTVVLTITQVIMSSGYLGISALSESFGFKTAFLVCAGVDIIAFILFIVLKDKYLGRTEEEIKELQAQL